MSHLQCWEFKKCGREVTMDCPAVVKKAGDLCWMVAGTLCGGQAQGTFVKKIGNCKKCDFFEYMQQRKAERANV
jgi:methyl-accepting chemotaxis protein